MAGRGKSETAAKSAVGSLQSAVGPKNIFIYIFKKKEQAAGGGQSEQGGGGGCREEDGQSLAEKVKQMKNRKIIWFLCISLKQQKGHARHDGSEGEGCEEGTRGARGGMGGSKGELEEQRRQELQE